MGSWLRITSGESKVNMNKFQVITILSSVLCLTQSQLSFGKGGSSGSSSSSSSSSTSNRNGNTKPDTDQRIISTGDSFVDGGILGVGAGLLGGAVLSGALNGGNNNNYNPCGRRKRQVDDGKTDTRFLGALLGGGNSGGCNCGRRKRQAPHEGDVGTRFFGLDTLLGGGNNNCGCNCGYPNNNYPNNNYPNNNYPNNNNNNFQQQQCQCNYNLTFKDRYGNTHGACRRADETGRTWCYTYGGCPDSRQSSRFPNNPWSYQACQYSG